MERICVLAAVLATGCGAGPAPVESSAGPAADSAGGETPQVAASAPAAPSTSTNAADGVPDPDDVDGDGFSDGVDMCPLLHAISEDGCPQHLRTDEAGADILQEPRIEFRRGTAAPRESALPVLETLRGVLDAHRALHIRIEAHTFDRGDLDQNLELSLRRAEAVAEFLTSRGVERDRLEVYGCGKYRPRYSVRGRNRFDNRRVELKVLRPLPRTGYPSTRGCVEVKAEAEADTASGSDSGTDADSVTAPVTAADSDTDTLTDTNSGTDTATDAGPVAATATDSDSVTAPVTATAADAATDSGSATDSATDSAADPASGDRDGDGVGDGRDRCPRAPGPRAARGCPKRHALQLEHGRIGLKRRVHFVGRGAELKRRSGKVLGEVAATLQANPTLCTTVEVRTPSLERSAARAAAIRDYLVERGVAAERLRAAGCPGRRMDVEMRVAEGAPCPTPADGCKPAN
jgi:outer membrane protein OmpA-like peptidoglycan-associated protein